MAKGKSFYDEYAFKRLRSLGFDRKFANKIAKRKDAIDESLRLEELAGKFRGDTKVAKDVFEGNSSKNWTGKQRQNFIHGTNEKRIQERGKFAGQLTAKEKTILNNELKGGDLGKAMKTGSKGAIDKESRLDKFKSWIGKGKKPPKYVKEEIIKLNKEMGASPNAKKGMFVLREMEVKGKTKEDAIAYVQELTNPINKDEVFYT